MSSISAEKRLQIKQLRKARKNQFKQVIPNSVYVPPVHPASEYIHYNNELHSYSHMIINQNLIISDIFIFMECILKYVTIKEWKEFMVTTAKYKKNIIHSSCEMYKNTLHRLGYSYEEISRLIVHRANLFETLILKKDHMLGFIFRIDKIIYKYAKKLPLRINTIKKIVLYYSLMNDIIHFPYNSYFPKYFIDLLYKIKFYRKITISRSNVPIFIQGASRAPLITYGLPGPLYSKQILITQLTQNKINAYKLTQFTKYLENTSEDDVYSIIAVDDIMSVIASFVSGISKKTYQDQIAILTTLDYTNT